MRIQFFIILFFITNLSLGQNIEYNIAFGPNISFLNNNQMALGYSVPINPATGNPYNNFNNSYTRNGDIGVGGTLGFKLDYNFSKKFHLISGGCFDYLNNMITTQLSTSSSYLSLYNAYPQLTLGQNINGYIPYDAEGNSLWRILIDENGILVRTDETDFETFKIEEKFNIYYISIPTKIGFSVTKNVQFNVGVVNSILIYSNINTIYPFIDNRIKQDNISTLHKYLFSVEGGILFKVGKQMGIYLNYQRSITDIIDLNSRYGIKNGNKINNFSLGFSFQTGKKE